MREPVANFCLLTAAALIPVPGTAQAEKSECDLMRQLTTSGFFSPGAPSAAQELALQAVIEGASETPVRSICTWLVVEAATNLPRKSAHAVEVTAGHQLDKGMATCVGSAM